MYKDSKILIDLLSFSLYSNISGLGHIQRDIISLDDYLSPIDTVGVQFLPTLLFPCRNLLLAGISLHYAVLSSSSRP